MRSIRPESFLFSLVLGLLGALPPLSIDISAPTLLVMQAQMNAPSSLVVLTITLFMAGFAVGQFTAGPASDRHGRRPVLLIGLLSYTTAAIGCSLASTIEELVAWRLVQGIGAGACAVLTFAIIRDVFEGDKARAKRSYITVIFGVAPMLAPILGAWIMDHSGWRAVYLVLSIGATVLLIAVTLGVSESRVATASAPQAILRSYALVLADRRFLGLVVVNALSYGSIFSYIAGSPTVLMGSLHLSPTQYGEVFACTAFMLTGGSWVSGRCAQRGIGAVRLLWFALGFGALSGVVLGGLALFGLLSLPAMLVALMGHLFCRGLTAPNVQHIALEPMREQAGTAAAAVGVVQISAGALASAVVALLLPVVGPLGMTGVMAVLSTAALALWIVVQRTAVPA